MLNKHKYVKNKQSYASSFSPTGSNDLHI